MANSGVGAKPTKISNTFDGICVKTIVFTSPILSAILAAPKNENAVSTAPTENMYERVANSIPNLLKNQSDTIL